MKRLGVVLLIVASGAWAGAAALGADLYDETVLRTFELEFEDVNWEQRLKETLGEGGLAEPIKAHPPQEGQDSGPDYVKAKLTVDGQVTLEQVGVQYKGVNSASAEGKKMPYKITTDAFVEDQTLWGHDKLTLNNGIWDASMMREVISYKILRKYMPAPRANFVKLRCGTAGNMETIGIYASIERIDRTFLRRHFRSSRGHRYKAQAGSLNWLGDDPNSYRQAYDVHGGDKATRYKDLVEVINRLNHTSAEQLVGHLDPIFSIDRAIRQLAAGQALANWDDITAFAPQGHNYYLYEDAYHHQMTVLPWDWDLALDAGDTRGWDPNDRDPNDLDPNDWDPNGWDPNGWDPNGWDPNDLDPNGWDPNGWDLNDSESHGCDPNLRDSNDPLYEFHCNEGVPVVSKLMTAPGLNERYLAFLRIFAENDLDWAIVSPWVTAYRELIEDEMAANENELFDHQTFLRSIETLQRTIEGKRTILLNHKDVMAPAPTIADVNHTPTTPRDDDTVWVTATVTSSVDIGSVTLYWRSQGSFLTSAMYDDGQHQDEAIGDGLYGASIDSLVGGRVMEYYIEAQSPADAGGGLSFDPIYTEHRPHSFQVDFAVSPASVFINEFVARNTSGAVDESGAHEDWIELYNAGPVDVNLAGFTLTDDLARPDKWIFPRTDASIIPAGGFLIVWCDDDPEDGPLHASFKLSGGGETIALLSPIENGRKWVDRYKFGQQGKDTSVGRTEDGGSAWTSFSAPSPKRSNRPGPQ